MLTEKQREYKRLYRIKNHDKLLEQAKNLYRKNNMIEYHRKWRSANRDKVNMISKLSRIRNIEKVRAYEKAYSQRDYVIAKRRAKKVIHTINARKLISRIKAENPHRYKIMIKTAGAVSRYPGKLLIKDTQRLYEENIKLYGSLTCYLCLEKIVFGDDSLDHKTPLTKGGTNTYENLGITHLICNKRKMNKTVEEYLNAKNT